PCRPPSRRRPRPLPQAPTGSRSPPPRCSAQPRTPGSARPSANSRRLAEPDRPGTHAGAIAEAAATPPPALSSRVACALGRWAMGRTAAWVGLVVALAAGTAVRWTRPADVEDLKPRPDALEYEEAARNIVAGEGYSLILDGGRYPPRYPPGFSMLLVPAVWLSGGTYGVGIWVVLAAALAGIGCVWAVRLLAGGPGSAAAASLPL